MEELSIRADIALGQKKVIREITGGNNEEFHRNYHALSAQVVRIHGYALAFCTLKLAATQSLFFVHNNESG